MRAQRHDALLDGFTAQQRALLRSLDTPHKIQDFIDALPSNKETDGVDRCKSPLLVLREGNAHCIEAAILAALCLRLQGKKALLVDLTADDTDQDHVLAVFKEHGCWGAVAKSNHYALGYRDAIYKTLRELVMSYVHEYLNTEGEKSLRSWAGPLDLRRFDKHGWATSGTDVWEIAQALVDLPHKELMTRAQIARLRTADPFLREMNNVKRDDPKTIGRVPFTRNEA